MRFSGMQCPASRERKKLRCGAGQHCEPLDFNRLLLFRTFAGHLVRIAQQPYVSEYLMAKVAVFYTSNCIALITLITLDYS